jgi:hypothetical protein
MSNQAEGSQRQLQSREDEEARPPTKQSRRRESIRRDCTGKIAGSVPSGSSLKPSLFRS